MEAELESGEFVAEEEETRRQVNAGKWFLNVNLVQWSGSGQRRSIYLSKVGGKSAPRELHFGCTCVSNVVRGRAPVAR